MGKRKQAAPQHADQAKRQQMQWNMSGQFVGPGSGSFICDGALRNESLNHSDSAASPTSGPSSSAGETSSDVCTPVHALCVDAFYQNLASCHSTLTLHNPHFVKAKDRTCILEFGDFKVTLTAQPKLTPLPDVLPEFRECWLYLADTDNPSMLYFETEDNNENVVQQKRAVSRQTKFGVFWFVSLSVPIAALAGLKSKSFLLLCSDFDRRRKEFRVTVYGREMVLLQLSHPSESVRIKTPQVAIQRLMEFYYDVHPPYNYEGQERTLGHDFMQVYESVMSIQLDRLSTDRSWLLEVDSIHHDCLKPVLRHYQRQSVAWMLRQEKRSRTETDEIHPLYCEVTLRDGTILYYNKHAGSLIRSRPKAVPAQPGGILADEMGLGKTVEVLCCMLLHPRPDMELPEQLPVLDADTTETMEISELVNSSQASGGGAVEDRSQEEMTVERDGCAGNRALEDRLLEGITLERDGYAGDEVTHKNNSLVSCSQEVTANNSKPVLTGSCATFTFKQDQVLTVITKAVLEKLPDNQQAKLFTVCSKSPLSQSLASPAVCNVSVAQSVKHSTAQNELQLLHKKETIDLTDDNDCEWSDTSNSGSGVQQSVPAASTGVVRHQVQSGNCQVSHTPGSSNNNRHVTKLMVSDTTAVSASGFSSSPQATNQISLLKNNVNIICTSSHVTQPTSEGSPAEASSQSSHSQSDTEENAHQKKRRKRKSRGYVEYVPITSDDTGYFSFKPTAQKQFFECNCGQLDDEEETRRRGLNTVKCNLCGMSQHAECMNYDLKDAYRGEYRCPHCHAVSTTIKSGATLIISPYSICHQWIEEISKHIKERSIKVFIYTGVAKLGYIQPQTLAQQDIVITTYDVLRKEVDYVNLPHTNSESGRRFRHPKRFLATPSPMVAVEWWRICLDEAQMVECVTTKTAEMALKLKAVNRWCVTGTPLMRSVEDIYGLLLFLGVDPLLVQQWFRLLLWEPFCHGFTAPMYHALSHVLWRTAKKDVIDQIDLPDQTEEVNWLTFSPVEEHFYRRQYEMYLRNAYANRKKTQSSLDPSTKLHALDRRTMSELLSPLFRLRQACCHPQIVRGEFLPLNKSMMTMEELLEHMTKKVKTECEEAHRQVVASLNGMAGLAILRGKIEDAVEKYRDVLRSVDEHKDQFRTDELQQLHAMHNLAEMLEQRPAGIAPTLRDSSLKEQCEELKKRYMMKSRTNVAASKEVLESTQATIKELSRKLSALDGDWWADVVDMTVNRGIESDLIYKIKDDLLRASTTEGTIADVFSNANGLMYVVDSHLQTLTKARQSLTTELDLLATNSSPTLVREAALCCLRPVSEVLKTCPFCTVDELFNEYESKLFLFVERGLTVTGDDSNLAYQVSTKRQGTWADSEVERVIKSILAFYRLHFDPDHDILEAASLQLKYMETLKKEFKNLRSVWLSHRELISAVDELEMATERLRLRKAFEPESANKILNVIEENEMKQQELKCSSDEIVARNELKKKLGQLIYLTNLAKKNQNGQDSNPDACPICQCGLGVEWSVLMCGHCYCLSCIRALIDRNLIGGHLMDRRLKCPMCRHMTPVREISYVTTIKTEKVDVKGSHSTKVQAVIQCLIKIRQQDPTAKSLVFSVWVSVLDILAAALSENNIPYKSLHDPNYFQKNLLAFKSQDSIQVLLLPLHTGANGLNLVEANHVLLVEPELNLEEEAQAISRIYRIGQTRKTRIHRFLVRGTIEEKIYHMIKTLRESKNGPESLGEGLELTVGHITSLLLQPAPADDEDEDVDDGVGAGSGAGLGSDVSEHAETQHFGESSSVNEHAETQHFGESNSVSDHQHVGQCLTNRIDTSSVGDVSSGSGADSVGSSGSTGAAGTDLTISTIIISRGDATVKCGSDHIAAVNTCSQVVPELGCPSGSVTPPGSCHTAAFIQPSAGCSITPHGSCHTAAHIQPSTNGSITPHGSCHTAAHIQPSTSGSCHTSFSDHSSQLIQSSTNSSVTQLDSCPESQYNFIGCSSMVTEPEMSAYVSEHDNSSGSGNNFIPTNISRDASNSFTPSHLIREQATTPDLPEEPTSTIPDLP